MTCRHGPNDPTCGSYAGNQARAQKAANLRAAEDAALVERALAAEKERERQSTTPDSSNYTIEDFAEIGGKHLVIKASYPNCRACSYEGMKILVYLNVSVRDAFRWRKIDPHFVEPGTARPPSEAPGPSARFPGSAEGWRDAVAYATSKTVVMTKKLEANETCRDCGGTGTHRRCGV